MESKPLNNFITQEVINYDYIDLTRPIFHLNLFFEEEIDNILKYVENNLTLSPFSDRINGSPNNNLNRKGCSIDFNDETFFLFKRVLDTVIDSNKTQYNLDLLYLENMLYFEYGISETGLEWHMDIGPAKYNNRKLSFVLFCNHPSEYNGGNLEIYDTPETFKIPSSKGSLVIFPSFLLHRVSPLKKGNRKVIAGFLNGLSYR